MPDLAHAGDTPVIFENALVLGPKLLIPSGAIRLTGATGEPLRQMIAVGGRGDRQNVADRLSAGLATPRPRCSTSSVRPFMRTSASSRILVEIDEKWGSDTRAYIKWECQHA